MGSIHPSVPADVAAAAIKLSWLSSHEAGGVAPSEKPESPGSSREDLWPSSLDGKNQDSA